MAKAKEKQAEQDTKVRVCVPGGIEINSTHFECGEEIGEQLKGGKVKATAKGVTAGNVLAKLRTGEAVVGGVAAATADEQAEVEAKDIKAKAEEEAAEIKAKAEAEAAEIVKKAEEEAAAKAAPPAEAGSAGQGEGGE